MADAEAVASVVDNRPVNRAAFENIATRLEDGEQLTFEAIGDIFGKTFWIMLLYTVMDAAQAARAIDGAIRRLSGKES